jgi:aminopeptidase N
VIGTERFWAGIRNYYRRYRDHNASTDDLRQVMEQASGSDLAWFFDQWLKRPGMPKLSATWRYDAAARQIEIDLQQTQAGAPFRLPLEVGVARAGGQPIIHRVELTGASGRFTFPADAEPAAVSLDPNTWVLAESIEILRR